MSNSESVGLGLIPGGCISKCFSFFSYFFLLEVISKRFFFVFSLYFKVD